MDEIVRKAMEKWPQVPALFGWLGLDRRGRWLLQGKAIEREPLVDFIGRNYALDEHGRWFFQNGPQRAFIRLEYTPWVFRVTGDGRLETHTRLPVERLDSVWLDEDGSLLLAWERGVGLLDDAELGWAFEQLTDGAGQRLDEPALIEALERLQAQEPAQLCFQYGSSRLPIQPVRSDAVPLQFDFAPEPAPLEGEKASS